MNFIFGYKVLSNRKVGFPESAYDKVIEILENYHISYQIVYIDKEPYFKDFKKQNKYEHFYNLAYKLLDKQNRIDLIIKKLNKAEDKDIEEVIKVIENCFR
mgnify:CR=1 FL=1